MAGYFGYSMSNNARMAYADGEMPLSKWTKTAIIDEIEDSLENKSDVEKFKKLTVKQLKNNFLSYAGWHHTSKKYNETNFYSIDFFAVDDFLSGKLSIEKESKAAVIQQNKKEMIEIEYPVWEGSIRHPKIIGYETMIGEVKGEWCISSNKRKKITGTCVKVLRKWNE